MIAGGLTSKVRGLINRSGFDIVRYPRWNTTPWALQHLLRELKIDCVLDVGGHHGEYGAMLREIEYRGRIISFEPVPESYRILAGRCASDPLWQAYPMAAGSRAGVLTLHVTAAANFASFLRPAPEEEGPFTSELTVERTEEVEVRPLGELLANDLSHLAGSRLFLKTDTQGFDFEVIEGLGEKIAEVRGLQVELAVRPLYEGMRPFPESLDHLEKLGYQVYCLAPVSHDASFGAIEYDCILRQNRNG